MEYSSLSDRVSNGVNFLNGEMPDWRSKVDWDRLRVINIHDCLLGQLFSTEVIPKNPPNITISDKLRHNGYCLKTQGKPNGWVAEHGFATVLDLESSEELGQEWMKHK